MSVIHEICQYSILTSNKFSKEANDYLIEILETEKDGYTAAQALLYNSRYQQLNKDQRLRLLKLSLLKGYEKIILNNYSYLSRARKYEIDFLMNNVDIEKIIKAFKNYPKDYKESIINRYKNDKLNSIFTMIELMN